MFGIVLMYELMGWSTSVDPLELGLGRFQHAQSVLHYPRIACGFRPSKGVSIPI
jgi:hypothetical protein